MADFRILGWRWKFAIGAALGLPWVLIRIAVFGFSPELPYLVFYPGVAIAAALGGAVAGLGAAIVSIVAGTLWSAPALTAAFLLRFLGFLFYAAAVCGLAEALHRALWRLGEAEGRRAAAEKLVEDLTERKRREAAAARTVSLLTAVLDGAKDAIIAIDINGVIQSINAAGERMFGYERNEAIGCKVGLLMPQGDAERHDSFMSNYLETGVSKVIGVGREMDGRRKDGFEFPIELAIVEAAVENDLLFVGFVRDLSERRRIDSRIDQLAAQRLTAIGGMAGAMAHELNQPLAAIGVYLETARRMLLKPADQRPASVEDAIARALTQVERMGDIIGHLRDFVGHGEADKTYQSLHALIQSVVSEAISDGRKGCALALELFAKRDDVIMDPVQIGQVLSNLVRNAREAVGEAPGGRVAISTALEGDDTIRCDVSDNGPGLADAVRDRLFEPLNSNKPTGMGVGLSISKSIIEAHYGRIWARTNPHGGAVFSFTLPLATEESDE